MKYLNLLLQLLGALASLASFTLVFYAKEFFISVLLLSIAIFAITIYIWRTRIRPITFGKLIATLELLDAEGNLATFVKKYELKANQNNITQLIDQNMSADGRIDYIKTSLSKNIIMVAEGGTKKVYTILDYPLPVNKIVVNELSHMIIDSFTSSRESFSCIVDRDYTEIELVIKFHKDHMPSSIRFIEVESGVAHLDDNPVGLIQGKACVKLRKPSKGKKCILEWDW